MSKRSKQILLAALLVGSTVVALFVYVATRSTISNSTDSQPNNSQSVVPLSVQIINPEREVLNTFTEVTVISNKDIQLVSPRNRVELVAIGVLNQQKYYVARVKNLSNGETVVNIVFEDANSQRFESTLKINKGSFTMPAGYTEIPAWPEATYILDADNYKGPINKQFRLLEDYEPADIVDLNKAHGIFTFNEARLRADAAAALKRMLEELRKQTGKSVTVASGYRSFNEQMSAHSGILIRQGETAGLKISARPGHSEHQLGTTVDITDAEVNYGLVQGFENTAAGEWLIANSESFGFVRSLDEQQTDYIYEPWHFRYIGGSN